MSRLLVLLFLCLPMMVGCDGCRQKPDPKDKEKEQKAKQEEFAGAPPQPLPADRVFTTNVIKPGHWLTATQKLKANKRDTRGELTSRVQVQGMSIRAGTETKTPSKVISRRPVVLPKGQNRKFDFRILPPIPGGNEEKTALLRSRFTSSSQALFYEPGTQPYRLMSAEEYFFVILTTRPNRFSKFFNADWVRPYRDPNDQSTRRRNYRIVIPDDSGVIAIPDTMLDWTSTAVLLYDDLPPEALTPDQQAAISDWVNFGGRLVINGPTASTSLDQTDLRSMLPLAPTSNIELNPESAQQLLEGWSVATDRTTKKQVAIVKGNSSRIALDGVKSPEAEVLDRSGGLVMSKRIGRGNVIQARVDLTSNWLSDWGSFQSFINNAILGRPARKYVRQSETDFLRQAYEGSKQSSASAHFNTGLRLFFRDAALRRERQRHPGPAKQNQQIAEDRNLHRPHPFSGLAGWNDDSDTAKLFQDALRSESGIEIPKSSLVIRSLSIYLIVLVPINYIVFRLMRRLEYAWMAVPVIAIGGAVWVARAARLDIGFARSQTEIALLETQPDHPRGHISRVVAIYNSLSTRYEVDFKTIDAAALPVPSANNANETAIFDTAFKEGPTLSGLVVGSNQIRLMHTEQIVDMAGSISLVDESSITNASKLDILDCVAIHRDEDGELHVAIIGGLPAGSKSTLSWKQTKNVPMPRELPMQMTDILRRMASPSILPKGAMRMVGRVEDRIEGMLISPPANQSVAQTVLLAHLKHPASQPPRVDTNLASDFARVATDPLAQTPEE